MTTFSYQRPSWTQRLALWLLRHGPQPMPPLPSQIEPIPLPARLPIDKVETKVLAPAPQVIACRRAERDRLTINIHDPFWSRLNRQVFALTDARRTASDIARMVNRPKGYTFRQTVELVKKALNLLMLGGYITLHNEQSKRPLIQIDILETTLRMVTETPEKADAFVRGIYEKLFDPIKNGTRSTMTRQQSDAITNEICGLFVHTDWEYMRRSMLGTLAAVVNGMKAGDPNIMPSVRKLGERHQDKHGVKPEHYPIVGHCLLATLKESLPRSYWVKDVEDSWTHAYQMLSEAMTLPQTSRTA